MPNGGYASSNGITLSPDAHKDVEYYLQCERDVKDNPNHMGLNFYLSSHPHLSPDHLYELIGSSYEKAKKDCESLK